MNTVVDRLREECTLPLLKVTGGEIFLVQGIMDFLEAQSAKHAVLVVQTNGVLLTAEHLARFQDWGNVVIQVSLDSHLFPGNSYRVRSERLHTQVVRRVEAICRSSLPVEIYGVLNDRSVQELDMFADWLRQFPPHLLFFPFPVRGPDSSRFAVRQDQVELIERFIDRCEEWAEILPPGPYFNRLLSFYRQGKRTFRCHVPRLVISTFSDGVVTPCPNIWFTDMGSALSDDWKDVLSRVGETGLYQALLAERPRLAACQGCFTPWDTLSMYLEDEISLDELCQAPTYSPPEVRRRIEEIKGDYLASKVGACRS